MSFDHINDREKLPPAPFDPRDFHSFDLENGSRSKCRSQKFVLRHENPAEYEALHKKWWDEYQPSGQAEETLVQLLIDNHWLFKRARLRLEQVEWDMPINANHWTEDHRKRIDPFTRFKATAERSFQRAFREVEHHFRECVRAENMIHKSELMRLKIEAEIARKPGEVKQIAIKIATPLYRDHRERAAARIQSITNPEIRQPDTRDSSSPFGIRFVHPDEDRPNSPPGETKNL